MKKHKKYPPVQTISTIRKILNDLDLLLYEKHIIHKNFNSCRVSIGNNGFIPLDIGTNGKGMSFEYSLASGYAEFMERLQNNILLNAKKMLTSKTFNVFSLSEISSGKEDTFTYSHDEQTVDIRDVDETFLCDFGKMCGINDKVSLENFISKLYQKVKVVPFWNINKRRIIYLPIDILLLLTGSNGMASGNSPKEAMLQALCEIFERYAISEIYWKNLTPPSIPLSLFEYSSIGRILLQYQKETGADIIIKDCSLGKGIPALGLIIIDKNKNLYNFKLGVDFVPTIALERCFTEIHQGRNVFQGLPYSFIKTKWLSKKEKKEAEDNLMKIFINGTGIWPNSILDKTESYKFEGFNINLGKSNVYDLNYSLNLIERFGYNVYVRNNSTLGFPTYYIVVPGMSQILKKNPFVSEFKQSFADIKYLNQLGSINHSIAFKLLNAIEENYDMMKKKGFELKRVFVYNINEDLNNLSIEMLAALLSLYLGKINMFVKYMDKYLINKDRVMYVYYYASLFYFRAKINGEDAYTLTSHLYGKELTTEVIKDTESPKKIFQYYKFPNCPHCSNCLLKDDCKQREVDSIQRRIKKKIIELNLDQCNISIDLDNTEE